MATPPSSLNETTTISPAIRWKDFAFNLCIRNRLRVGTPRLEYYHAMQFIRGRAVKVVSCGPTRLLRNFTKTSHVSLFQMCDGLY